MVERNLATGIKGDARDLTLAVKISSAISVLGQNFMPDKLVMVRKSKNENKALVINGVFSQNKPFFGLKTPILAKNAIYNERFILIFRFSNHDQLVRHEILA